MMTRVDCARWLEEHDRYVILTHRRPDGDTLGSAATLCRGLRCLGKEAHVLSNREVTRRYVQLMEGLCVDSVAEDATVISVDVASPQMLPEEFKPLMPRIALRIDHHFSATSFTPLELVDHTAGACGEIIYDVLMEMGLKMDKATAEALYTAVSTDTGCFRYANTTAHTLRTAAACMEAGGDLFRINQAIFETNSLSKLRLQGWMAEHTDLFDGGKKAVCALPLSVEQEMGVTEDDMDNVSGFTRSIEGVKIAATIRENGDGSVKVSVRAVPGYDASAVCAVFGGGGHKGAAGATLAMPLEQAAEKVKKVLEEQ